MIYVKSNQKVFTEDEISNLTGICSEHLRAVARSKHLGSIVRAAGAAGGAGGKLAFQQHGSKFAHGPAAALRALVGPACRHGRRAHPI